ncbi:hypothetical protein DXG01_015979 [Tephrocybe rancida]|nr:hypothetical protein DXG01_015979 [Tephrocybe rancida]
MYCIITLDLFNVTGFKIPIPVLADPINNSLSTITTAMPPKRRILVVFQPEQGNHVKLAISVNQDATNETLAREIAESVGVEGVKLEIGDGFELRRQDGIEVILDSDVVIAKPRPIQSVVEPSRSQLSVGASKDHIKGFSRSLASYSKERDGQEPTRFQIRLVTAELARLHAKGTLKDSTEPVNGVLAFGGHFVSGNTAVSALRQEAAEVLGWNSFGSSYEDEPCNHETQTICSCAIAHEVDLHGLSSTFHCRFNIDGNRCINRDCSYSHTSLSLKDTFGVNAPHCSVCDDALGFPCPSCLKQAEESGIEPGDVIHCAIVKTVPGITLVWDGDRIDHLPIPSDMIAAVGTMQHLATHRVISLVESFLRSKGVDMSGLSLRIHARNAQQETVRFVWSTLVSVCSTVLHLNQDHRRFTFPGLISSPASTIPVRRKAKSFEIDFHTSSCPVVVCGCATLKDILLLNGNSDANGDITATLYTVKRTCNNNDASSSKHGAIPISKQSAYQLDTAWQPSTPQTSRGMAALLASLFVLSEMVRKQGLASENKVLAALYSITRFPPAVRALGVLLLNIVPQPQEKAALSEALFYALKEFLHAAPPAFTINPSRRFETARILLGHILSITDVVNVSVRPLQCLSLTCALSHKRMVDPVMLDSFAVVERSSGALHSMQGLLYRPNFGDEPHSISELSGSELCQVLAQSKAFKGSEIHVLSVREIGVLARPTTLEKAGYNFWSAIQRANETDLICRGPLELKSPSVVPPQIVLDSEGFLAVFTGRGCGTTRDVNFFRPLSGGDTEVDVNDVEHALQKVIVARKVEDTWEVDCFGGVPAKARVPDEAIMLCLDLSQSMNERSAVGDSLPHVAYDHTTEGEKAIDEIVKGLSDAALLVRAMEWIQEQHESCFVAWKSLIEDELTTKELLEHLGNLTQRDRASFASANRLYAGIVSHILETFLGSYEPKPILGVTPYEVPRILVDPGTGNLKPPTNNPFRIAWASGQDLLTRLNSGHSLNQLTITLVHGRTRRVWNLPPSTSTRVLYSLANRATEASFSSFNLRTCTSRDPIRDSEDLPLSSTQLRMGGAIELYQLAPHSRKPLKINVTSNYSDTTIILPADASALALLSKVRGPYDNILSDIRLWRVPFDRINYANLYSRNGLTDVGDGEEYGVPVKLDSDISRMTSLHCNMWFWIARDSASEESRSLTRLHLLKELFNIFLNRVSSFDTSVSLVLGLVTFSDEALVKQELTPIFENFRLELDKVTAKGDTAMYDALDVARSSLINFRADLPNLRRRIIIVSDGEDTSSKSTLSEVGSALQRDHITVDSVQVGQTLSNSLHLISAATGVLGGNRVGIDNSLVEPGGYRFFPQASLGDALSIFDLETMMNSSERPNRPKLLKAFLPHRFPTLANDLSTYPVDEVTIDHFPERAQHPKLTERVKDVKQATASGTATSNSERTRRIMRELKALIADPHPQIDVYVNDVDMSFLKVVIQAPDDIEQCPYKGGCFLLTCDLPPQYPRDPPEIRFVTFILHPNVSKQGKVCVAELSRLWSSDITVKELLSLVYGLLLEPDLDNPLEIQASLKYYDDDGTFALAAAKAVAEHASKSRSAWREELDV